MDKVKICILSYSHLYNLVQETIGILDDDEIEIFTLSCKHETLPSCVQIALNMGAEAFIAGGSNYKIFQDNYDYPIVEIVRSLSDYIRCVSEVADFCKAIYIISYLKKPIYDFSLLEKILNIEIFVDTYNSDEDLEQQISQCKGDMIIGTSVVCECAAKMNKAYRLIYSKELEINNAILSAKKLFKKLDMKRTIQNSFQLY